MKRAAKAPTPSASPTPAEPARLAPVHRLSYTDGEVFAEVAKMDPKTLESGVADVLVTFAQEIEHLRAMADVTRKDFDDQSVVLATAWAIAALGRGFEENIAILSSYIDVLLSKAEAT